MSAPPRPLGHEWERSAWIWDTLTAATGLATVITVWFSDAPHARRVWAAGLLLTVLALYVLTARPMVRRGRQGGPLAIGYVVAAVGLFTASALLVPSSWGIVFALIPHCFMVLPMHWAICAVVALNVAPRLPTLAEAEGRWANVGSLFGGTLLVTTFSVAFGAWIGRIVRQSRERAELIEQLTVTQAKVARLSREAGAAAERERMAGEIHDTLAQGFTTIVMLLQGAEAALEPGHPAHRPIGLATRAARENLAEARALVASRPPAPLESAPLAEALRRLAERLGQEMGGASSFEIEGTPRALTPSLDVVLLRVAQEALANVRKHAAARSVRVSLSYGEDAVRLRVADDGRGFDPAAVTARPGGGFGLAGLRQRVEQSGGVVDITGAQGGGTVLAVSLPCPT